MRVSRMTLVALAAVAAGCAGSAGGCGGAGVAEPIPGGFSGQKKANAAVVHVSAQGFDYLNTSWRQLFAPLLPGAVVSGESLAFPIPMPCTDAPVTIEVPIIGGTISTSVVACDNGAAGHGSVGFMDGVCDANDAPCPILVTIDRVRAVPRAPDALDLEIDVRLDATKDPLTGETGEIYFDTYGRNVCPAIPFVSDAKPLGCYASFHSDTGSNVPDPELLSATVKFSLSQHWDGQLSFALAPPDPSQPDVLVGGLDEVESEDIAVVGCDEEVPCGQDGVDWCDLPCNTADLFKGVLIDNFVKPQLQSVIQGVIDGMRCRSCDPSDPLVAACPGEGVDSFCECPEGDGECADADRVCISSAARGGACVPALLGVEQYLNTGALLSKFGADPASRIETFAAAGGGSLVVSPGLQVGMLGGAKASERAACVPDRPAPAATNPPTPSLAAGPAHHVGVALSVDFLNGTMYEAHRSGAACLAIGTAQAAPLTTGLFKTFLPSLGLIAGSEAADAPMMIALRPIEPPVVHVGEGSFDPVTNAPDEPLVTLDLKDVRIDFYAMVEGRYARLFTLAADLKLPLWLIAEGCPTTLQPVLGDLKSLITIRDDVPLNSELLAEDPQALAQLVPMVLGMAEPVLATLLQPMPLPDLSGLRLRVEELQGISPIAGSPDYSFLGLFASLRPAGQCEGWGPGTEAKLVERLLPPREALRLEPGRALPWPSAVIEVSAEDLPGQSRPMEYAWRIDGGLWSRWVAGPRLEVTHPALLLPGRHRVEVRARVAGEPGLVDRTPESLELLVDWDAPAISMSVDRQANRIEVAARDAVSPAEALRYSYRLGSDEPSQFGPARAVDLAAVERAGGLEVRVQDESGNLASARWSLEAFAAAGRAAPGIAAGQESAAGGCSSAGGGLAGLLALALAPFALRRRRG